MLFTTSLFAIALFLGLAAAGPMEKRQICDPTKGGRCPPGQHLPAPRRIPPTPDTACEENGIFLGPFRTFSDMEVSRAQVGLKEGGGIIMCRPLHCMIQMLYIPERYGIYRDRPRDAFLMEYLAALCLRTLIELVLDC